MAVEREIAKTRTFGAKVDFGKTASDYRAYRAGFPPEFFEALAERGWVRPAEHALDLGTGTGTVARGLAKLGMTVTGADPASTLLDEAAALDREAGVDVSYRIGFAEKLPEASESVQLVTAGQCWHWLDRAAAAREASRVLVPGGRIVIAHFDWLPLAGNVVEATEELILMHNPSWTMAGGNGIYPGWLRDLAEASFVGLETFSFDVSVSYSQEAWRGRIRASAGVKASLGTAAIENFDAELSAILRESYTEDPLSVPHRVWVASGVKSS
jgi:SAM-dependent methyltransferase